jgi:hypothetical protein
VIGRHSWLRLRSRRGDGEGSRERRKAARRRRIRHRRNLPSRPARRKAKKKPRQEVLGGAERRRPVGAEVRPEIPTNASRHVVVPGGSRFFWRGGSRGSGLPASTPSRFAPTGNTPSLWRPDMARLWRWYASVEPPRRSPRRGVRPPSCEGRMPGLGTRRGTSPIRSVPRLRPCRTKGPALRAPGPSGASDHASPPGRERGHDRPGVTAR